MADLQREPRVKGLGGKTACQWQRHLREECKKTEAKLEKLTEEKKNLAKEKKALKLQTKALKGKVQSLEARLEELKEVIESKVPNYLEIYLNSTNGALAEEDDSNVEVSQ